MRTFHVVLCLSLAVVLALGTTAWLLAATPEQEAKAAAIEEALKQAGDLVKAKKYEEAKPLALQAQVLLSQLAGEGAAVKNLVAKLHGKLAPIHRALTRKGIELPELPAVADLASNPPAGTVSFTEDIVPIITGRCNGCHVQGSRGNFSMASYNALMRGSDSGVVFTPGKSEGSRLIDVLQSGDMPRGGGPLSPEQIASIAKWIDEGAIFDGTDPNARIMGTGQPNQPDRPMLQVTRATGNEEVLFSRDIAPVLAEQCIGCHGGRQPRAQLSLETFAALLAGNNNGLILAPGDSAGSQLIKRLKGEVTPQMPLDSGPLPAETIALFEKWVAEGARFDGRDPAQNVQMVADVYRATQMSHEELAAYRSGLADRNWKLGIPDMEPDRAETESFLLVGDVGPDRLAEIGTLADQQVPKVSKILKAPAGQPLLKGKMTLFVFTKGYDYSEFGQMVESRDLPDGMVGHFRYTVVDAYGCVVPPNDEEYSLAALVGQQLAGAYIESLGTVPAWFSQGSAWAVGARVDSKDPMAKAWADSVPGLLAKGQKPDDFLSGQLPPGDTLVLNFAFCDFLMSNTRGYAALLSALKRGTPFDQAFQEAFRGTPAQLAGPWAARAVARGN
jgi:mono/diheme cytochrome c family protein